MPRALIASIYRALIAKSWAGSQGNDEAGRGGLGAGEGVDAGGEGVDAGVHLWSTMDLARARAYSSMR